MRTAKKIVSLTAALGLSLAATGCGGDDGGGSAAVEEGALDGVSITVASKNFTENILIGKMLVLALENAGADVTDQTNLGGTNTVRDALVSGDVDVSPEYNGTGWTVHLNNEDPSNDPEELFNVVAEADLEQNNIKWVGRSPFNDTYGFAANGDLAEQEGGFDLDGMAEYLENNPDTTVCMETEFPDRPDGLVLFEEATGYEVPRSQIQILDTGVIYTETDEGSCDFGEVFTTDGRIDALNMELVEDPGVFILYNVSYTFDNEVYQENPETYDEIAEAIFEDLDEEKMRELNGLVDNQGQQPDRVAEEYLSEKGVIG